jgi:hypothetical protein
MGMFDFAAGMSSGRRSNPITRNCKRVLKHELGKRIRERRLSEYGDDSGVYVARRLAEIEGVELAPSDELEDLPF